MELLLARYLDGELSEAEAATLLERAETDPRVARALASYERMLEAARGASSAPVPGGFADRVMRRVAERAPVRKPRRAFTAWGPAWVPSAAAAALAVGMFATGILAGRGVFAPKELPASGPAAVPVTQPATAPASPQTLLAGTPWITATQGDGLRVVRLVYVPRRPEVGQVTVAGSFNDWDPDALSMRRVGDVFVAVLSLPPGAYEYMFVEDSERWVTDPLALQTRDDGFGNANAVLDLTL